MTLTLYGGPRTRASMPRWYMEEKGIAYELVELDLRGNQHRQPDYLAVNPFGKLPALVDDAHPGPDGKALKLFESGAILLHLAEHHAQEIDSAVHRSLTAQWLLFANATLAIALFADLLPPGGPLPLPGDRGVDRADPAAAGLPQGDGHGLINRD